MSWLTVLPAPLLAGVLVVGLSTERAPWEVHTGATELRDSSGTSRVLDRREADFCEGEEARVVAALEATLVRERGRNILRLRASALGPRVDAAPGAEGLRGANGITAREIESLLAGGRAQVRVHRDGHAAGTGRVRAGRCGEVPRRRLLADGRVEHRGHRSSPVEVVFEAALSETGRHRVEVWVAGEERVRVEVVVHGHGGRVLSLQGLGGHAPEGGRP
jgi:hypothetical protein